MSIRQNVRKPLRWTPTTDGFGWMARDEAGRWWNIWVTSGGTWRASVAGKTLRANPDARTGRARVRGWRSRDAAMSFVEDWFFGCSGGDAKDPVTFEANIRVRVETLNYRDLRDVVMRELAEVYTRTLIERGGSVDGAAKLAQMDRSGFRRLMRRAEEKNQREDNV